MNKNLVIVIITFISFQSICIAQSYSEKVASLKEKVEKEKIDTSKIQLQIELAILYITKDSANAYKTLNEALFKSEKMKYFNGIYLSLNNLGILFNEYYNQQKSVEYYKQVEQLCIINKKEYLLGKLYSNLGNAYSDWEKDKDAIAYYKKSIEIELKYNNLKGAGITYNNLGGTYIKMGLLNDAIAALLQGIKLREQINDQVGIARMYSNLSVLYKELKEYDKAIEVGNKALKIFSANKMKRDAGIVYVNLGLVSYRLKKFTDAEVYYDSALVAFKDIQFDRGLAAIYQNRGIALKNLKKPQKAMENYEEAITLCNKMNDKEGITVAKIELADIYIHDFVDYKLAETYLKEAEKLAEELNYLEIKKDVYETLATLYKKQNNFEKATIYQTKFQEVKDSILDSDKQKQITEIQTKYETEKKELKINLLNKQDSIKTLQIANQQIDIKNGLLLLAEKDLSLTKADLQLAEDSLLIKKNNEELLEKKLQVQQNEERINLLNKEKQIKTLEVTQKNNTIIGISIGSVLLLLTCLFYIRNYQLQKKKELQEQLHAQQQKATIDILTAEEVERKRIAGDLHDGVGQTMMAAWLNLQAIQNNTVDAVEKEQLLQKAMLLVDESCKDVRAVSHNMMPNALLKKGLVNAVKEFINQIDNKVLAINVHSEGLNKELPAVTETILYRVIQESVNNVVKHAQATLLDISILNEADGIDVLIEDNGKGFDVSEALNKQNGLGLNNIKSRIEYLKGTVEWNSSTNNGTLVAIHIPV